MYVCKSTSEKGFLVKSNQDEFIYISDKDKKEGTTPVGLVNAALSGCVGMCTRGYLTKTFNKDDILIDILSNYDVDTFTFDIKIIVHHPLTQDNINGILLNIDKRCTVSKIFGAHVHKNITVIGA